MDVGDRTTILAGILSAGLSDDRTMQAVVIVLDPHKFSSLDLFAIFEPGKSGSYDREHDEGSKRMNDR